jgi:hypothetical protein
VLAQDKAFGSSVVYQGLFGINVCRKVGSQFVGSLLPFSAAGLLCLLLLLLLLLLQPCVPHP